MVCAALALFFQSANKLEETTVFPVIVVTGERAEPGGHPVIKVSVLYANHEGATFDMDYYCARHMPMVQRLLGTALKGVAVEQGLGGLLPGSPPAFLAMGHLVFDSRQAFQTAWAPHAAEIVNDVPKYTNIQPTILISEIRL